MERTLRVSLQREREKPERDLTSRRGLDAKDAEPFKRRVGSGWRKC